MGPGSGRQGRPVGFGGHAPPGNWATWPDIEPRIVPDGIMGTPRGSQLVELRDFVWPVRTSSGGVWCASGVPYRPMVQHGLAQMRQALSQGVFVVDHPPREGMKGLVDLFCPDLPGLGFEVEAVGVAVGVEAGHRVLQKSGTIVYSRKAASRAFGCSLVPAKPMRNPC